MSHIINRRRVSETDLSVSKIYGEEMSPLCQRGYEILTGIPTLSSIKSSLHKFRRRVQGISSEASTAADMLKLSDTSTFLLADASTSDRIIVFGTPKGKDMRAKRFTRMGPLNLVISSSYRFILYTQILKAV
ncbi:hypothetical protein AVEN_108972-1 [Araneus ventricosus]|uniref:Uncharacterized protein n=1 Tax=Araneus ventricosus TaxID=182803 RepID=A0A4Y2F5E2_ARAVE|nr:hypothetical protein AVEN_108972-1 [Araneus ventricosus]